MPFGEGLRFGQTSHHPAPEAFLLPAGLVCVLVRCCCMWILLYNANGFTWLRNVPSCGRGFCKIGGPGASVGLGDPSPRVGSTYHSAPYYGAFLRGFKLRSGAELEFRDLVGAATKAMQQNDVVYSWFVNVALWDL